MSRHRCGRAGFLAVFVLATGIVAWGQSPSGEKPNPRKKTPTIPPNVILERDVPYGQAGDRPLLLDIVRPKQLSEKPLPVIAYVHGGGWHAGSKEEKLGAPLMMAASGNYWGVSIEYRLSGVATWPAQLYDCKAAIRWIRAHAQRYHIDPEKIGVWGDSAGGHLVTLLGLTAGVKELEGNCGSPEQSSRVTCVVAYCTPCDFLAITPANRNAYGPVSELLGGPIEEKTELAKAASPITYVSKDAAPILIVHGTADATVPLAQVESFYAAMKKVGADATFITILDGTHSVPPSGGPKLKKRVLAFFDKYLRGQNVAVSDEPIQAQPRPQP
jgi:acetyl esterase/lipase